jgi:O-antigen/teichoic acid export membrane protein
MQVRELKRTLRRLTPDAVHDWRARIESTPIGKRLLHGAFWSTMGTMAARALALVAAVLAARIIGKTHYGELGIIQSTVGMFGTLAGFGMGTTTAKFVAELRGKDPAKAGRIIALSSLVSWVASSALAIGLVFLASWLCRNTLAAPHLTGDLQISALLLLLSGINGAQIGVLFGFEAFKSVARVNFLSGLLNFPLTVGGALLFGLQGIIWGLILAQAAGCVLNRFALRREASLHGIPISYASCMTELPVVWRFSIPAVLAHLVISVVNWAAASMLVRQPNGYSEMGAYNAANQWFNALMWLPYMFSNAVLPIFAERLGAGDKPGSVRLLKMSVKVNALAAFPLVAVGCLLSPYIMMSYGPGFRSAWPTLVAVLIAAGLLSLDIPAGELITASGRMWVGFASNIGWALLYLGVTALLLRWGSLGLASARMLAYFAHVIWSFGYSFLFVLKANGDVPIKPRDVGMLGGCVSEADSKG